MRSLSAPLTLLPLLLSLSGCFDYEGIELIFSAHAPRNRLQVELRAVGLHRDAVEDCTDTPSCRAGLHQQACEDPPDEAVSGWISALEIQEDGRLDRITRWEQSLDGGVLGTAEEGFLRAQDLRPRRDPRPAPTFGFLDTDIGLEAEVIRGRFSVLELDLGENDPARLFVMQSRKGTIRFSATLQDKPASPQALRWAASIPGLVESLAETPVTCTVEQARAL